MVALIDDQLKAAEFKGQDKWRITDSFIDIEWFREAPNVPGPSRSGHGDCLHHGDVPDAYRGRETDRDQPVYLNALSGKRSRSYELMYHLPNVTRLRCKNCTCHLSGD